MKKNLGFTLVELLASFVLASIIFTFLLELFLSIKNIYTNQNIKTEVLIKTSNLEQAIYNDLDSIVGITKLDDNNYLINLTNEDKKLSIDKENSKISYGDVLVKFDCVNLESLDVENYWTLTKEYQDNNILNISFKITNSINEEDYSINVVYQYNSRAHNIVLNGDI